MKSQRVDSKALTESPFGQCPQWLWREAKREWRRIVPILVEEGFAETVNRFDLANYCQAWARWVEAEKLINEIVPDFLGTKSNGDDVTHSYVHSSHRRFNELLKAMRKVGCLSPADRYP